MGDGIQCTQNIFLPYYIPRKSASCSREEYSEKLLLLNREAGWSERLDVIRLKLVAEVEQILQARQAVRSVEVAEAMVDYLLALVQRSRQHPDLALGASPRSAVAWLQTSKAAA